jgi:hypothetical protein
MQLRTFLFLLAVCPLANAADIYRFGSSTIEVGDSVAKLMEVAGPPLFKESIETPHGGLDGERWQYRQDKTVIQFTLKEGKIASIEESHE